jgi:hypothetical protein
MRLGMSLGLGAVLLLGEKIQTQKSVLIAGLLEWRRQLQSLLVTQVEQQPEQSQGKSY